MKKLKTQTVICFLNREQVDFLDKLGKDGLFSRGFKLSRVKIISSLVDLVMESGIDGIGVSSSEELKQRIKNKLFGRKSVVIEKKVERRQFFRLPLNLEVQYRTLESLQPPKVTSTSDMSEKGIRIGLAEYVAPQTRLELSIKMPSEPKPIKIIGRVVWVKKCPEKKNFTTGIHLIQMKEEDKEKFYKYALCKMDD